MMRIHFVALALLPCVLPAHELIVDADYAAPAAVVRVSYYDKAHAKGADVTVWDPSSADAAFISGRTDANGAFAFVPDRPGSWRIVADDGRGHRESIDLKILELGSESGSGAPARKSPFERALTGVSVIFGLTGLWMWRRARSLPAGSSTS